MSKVMKEIKLLSLWSIINYYRIITHQVAFTIASHHSPLLIVTSQHKPVVAAVNQAFTDIEHCQLQVNHL